MKCLVYLPHSYTGRGPAESCVRIIEHFAAQGIETTLFVHRAKAMVPPSVGLAEGGGGVLRKLPFRLVAPVAASRLNQAFKREVDRAAPGTIAYFWPDTPMELVRYAKAAGLFCVRELINSPVAHAQPILDAAYRAVGLEPTHGITDARVAAENAELALYDYFFSSNAEVDAALRNLGIPHERILASSFGWTKRRFDGAAQTEARDPAAPFRVVFVGLMNVRKGVPVLLEAWQMAGIDGELVLAGEPEDCLKAMITQACSGPGVRHLGHVSDVAALYRSSNVFVFPTHEEGGPQVTYEAAACGVPIITTSMGAARLIDHERTGLLVPAGDPAALAAAMHRLRAEPDLASRMAAAALEDVERFEYARVGSERAKLLLDALDAMQLVPSAA
jgi:glycosyltransferase involved in cell wall biosynthesis